MGVTSIEWTNKTWSPLRARVRADAGEIAKAKGYTSLVHIAEKMAGHVGPHCEHVSDGCVNCYSGTNNHRCLPKNGTGLPFDRRSRDLIEPIVDEKILLNPLSWKTPQRVFVENQSDLFGEWVTDEMIDRVFAVMALCPHLTFQILTKRPERMLRWSIDRTTPFRVAKEIDRIQVQGLIAKTPIERRPIPGIDRYFVNNAGVVFTDHGSATCVWCGALFGHGQQDSIFCSAKCRSASHYEKTQGRNCEPAGRSLRVVTADVAEGGYARARIIGGDRELVHRLVLRTFNRKPEQGEEGLHRDGDASNNHICNLRWGTQTENLEDRWRHGNGRSWAKLTDQQVAEIRARYRGGTSAQSIAPNFDISGTQVYSIVKELQHSTTAPFEWPLRNCHLGVSVEDQKTADERIPLLLQTPAAKRFVSYEPALGPVDFHPFLWSPHWEVQESAEESRHREDCPCNGTGFMPPMINQIIVGGESGPGARPFDIQWARQTITQCKAAGVKGFVKQMGSSPCFEGSMNGLGFGNWAMETRPPDKRTFLRLKDRKGGDMDRWPEDLRIRELI